MSTPRRPLDRIPRQSLRPRASAASAPSAAGSTAPATCNSASSATSAGSSASPASAFGFGGRNFGVRWRHRRLSVAAAFGGGIGGIGASVGGGLQVGGGMFAACRDRSRTPFRRRADGNVVRLQPRLRPARPRRRGLRCPALGIGDEVVRRDFADSAFWTAKLRTDTTGKATTTLQAARLAHQLARPGHGRVRRRCTSAAAPRRFKSRGPIMIWPMLPRTFTEGDTVRVFGTVHNLTDKEQTIARPPEGRERAGARTSPSRR